MNFTTNTVTLVGVGNPNLYIQTGMLLSTSSLCLNGGTCNGSLCICPIDFFGTCMCMCVRVCVIIVN